MDDLRGKDFKNQMEIKYLRERLRLFEGTSASGFKGFSGASNLMMTHTPQTNISPTIVMQQDLKLVAVN